ncbi:MAG: LysM peptidoglycan-binding domain-containing protein [Caldilineaceae bacterium]|nr:LysM peptidoglycan-binding domain-containing protein [Caldilineaceae bacterium]
MFALVPSKKVRRTVFLLLLCMTLMATLVPSAAFAAPANAPAASGNYHVVKPGQTLSHIARYYGVTVNALKKANSLGDANYIYVGQHLYIPTGGGGAPAGCTSYYYVRHGDSLSKVAAWYGMKTSALASANGLSNANYIYVGQKLCIPNIYGGGYGPSKPDHGGGYGYGDYRVKAGDTLSEIAKWNGTTVRRLMHLNGLSNPNYIYVGQWIRLS